MFANPDQAFATGIRLRGEKFIAFKADARSIYARKQVRTTHTYFLFYASPMLTCVIRMMERLL
jgi:hypothetical protein